MDGTGELDFDLRFVQGVDQEDAGMAASEVHASSGQQSGTVQVAFPDEGYVVHGISARSFADMVELGLIMTSLSRVSFLKIEFTCSSGYIIEWFRQHYGYQQQCPCNCRSFSICIRFGIDTVSYFFSLSW